jgi:beta-galactosidase/beta-glucuronidase
LWELIDVPNDFLITGKGTGTPGQGGFNRGVAWYRKKFAIPVDWKGSAISLHFDGVFKFSAFWLNGIFIDSHVLGYTGYTLRLDNITALRYGPGTSNVLAVFVSADHGSEWWYAGGGIYRHTQLVRSPLLHLDPASIFAPAVEVDSSTAIVMASAEVLDENSCALSTGLASQPVRFTLLDSVGVVQATAQSTVAPTPTPHRGTTAANLTVSNALQLWSIPSPALYTLKIELITDTGSATDALSVNIGIHTVLTMHTVLRHPYSELGD